MEISIANDSREHEADHCRIDMYTKQIRELTQELITAKKSLAVAEQQLKDERALQNQRLTELSVRLIEIEDDIKKEQRRVKALLRSKERQLKDKDIEIEMLKSRLSTYEDALPPVTVRNRDPVICGSNDRTYSENTPVMKSPQPKARDFSHLLYLDLNTDQSGFCRRFRHRDLSPVAEVREDLEDSVTSPIRLLHSSPCKRRLPHEMNEALVLDENEVVDAVDEELSPGTATCIIISSEEADALPLSTQNDNEQCTFGTEFSDLPDSNCKEDVAHSPTYRLDDQMPNVDDIQDTVCDECRNVVLDANKADSLTEELLGSSFDEKLKLSMKYSMDGVMESVIHSSDEEGRQQMPKWEVHVLDQDVRNTNFEKSGTTVIGTNGKHRVVIDESNYDEFFDCQASVIPDSKLIQGQDFDLRSGQEESSVKYNLIQNGNMQVSDNIINVLRQDSMKNIYKEQDECSSQNEDEEEVEFFIANEHSNSNPLPEPIINEINEKSSEILPVLLPASIQSNERHMKAENVNGINSTNEELNDIQSLGHKLQHSLLRTQNCDSTNSSPSKDIWCDAVEGESNLVGGKGDHKVPMIGNEGHGMVKRISKEFSVHPTDPHGDQTLDEYDVIDIDVDYNRGP